MKKLLMTVSIKRVAGQPDELKADLQAEADFPDDASVECMKEQLDEFKQLAAHCAKDLVGNHTPQRVIPASSDAASPIEKQLKSETKDSNQDSRLFPAKNPHRGASIPESNHEIKNKNKNNENTASVRQVNMIHAIIEKKGLRECDIFKEFGVNNFYNMTHKQVNQFKEKYDPEPSFR